MRISFGRFINARRRILQPMLDASNPETNQKAKKPKMQSHKTQSNRFWPDNIASIQPQVQNSNDSDLNSENQISSSSDAHASTSGKFVLILK